MLYAFLELDFEPNNSYNVRLLSRTTLALSLQKTADFGRTEVADSTAMSGSMSGLIKHIQPSPNAPSIVSEKSDRWAARSGSTFDPGRR